MDKKQFEDALYDGRVIDNRNIHMTDTLKYLLSIKEYKTLDIAVGYFYISGMLLLKDEFINFMDNRNGHLRILMGNETNGSTVNVLSGSKYKDYAALIKDKTNNDTSSISDKNFLGKINEWIEKGQMEIKVYVGKANYFHAKSYLFASTLDSKRGTAIVGSSNFSKNGFEGNTELNFLTEDGFIALHNWYSNLWISHDEVKDFSPDLINIVKSNGAKSFVQEYKPVKETYYDFANLYGRPYTKLDESQDWVKELFAHQRTGVVKIKEKLDSFGTAVLADGVGLGKTRTAAGVIRLYLQSESVNNILVIADTKLHNQWKDELKTVGIEPSQYKYLSRQKMLQIPTQKLIDANYTLIIIDEAHLGFKNNNTEAYRKVATIKRECPNIKGLMLTATPWNNTRNDVLNIGSLFLNVDAIPQDRKYKQYYLLSPKHITNRVINHLSADDEAFKEFWNDIYLQRTRKTYGGKGAYFPHRNFPTVDIPYEPRKNQIFSDNFDIIANLTFPYQDPIKYIDDSKEEIGAKQLKMMLLKRADSSWKAFEISLKNIMKKLKLLKQGYLDPMHVLKGKALLQRYKEFLGSSYDIVSYEDKNNLGLFKDFYQTDDSDPENSAKVNLRKKRYIEKLKTQIDDIDLRTAKNAISKMTADCNSDLETLQNLVSNLNKAYSKIDEKVEKIIECVQNERLKKHKIILVSQFADTVEYYYDILYRLYNNKRITFPMGMITGANQTEQSKYSSKLNDISATKENVLNHFSPISKKKPELIADKTEIDLIVATDTISTGQNLQDAVTLMNIDLPYNPMTLEQRIGRIDRPLPAGSHDKQIFIYTFPIYESINSQLKMTTRLKKKMNGVLQDTEFDNVVLPGYQDYLKNIKAKKHNAVKTMLDETEKDESKFNAVASEKHSAAYEQANERMYNFKVNKFKPLEKPLVPYFSFSNSKQDHSIVVVKIEYYDVNDSFLDKENVIVDVTDKKISKIVNAENNLNQEITHDVHNTHTLNENSALLLVQQAQNVFKEIVQKKVSQYNKQRKFFEENTKTLNNSVSEKAAIALKDSAQQNPKMVMDKLQSVNVDSRQLANIIKFIKTIDKDDDLFEYVEEIKKDPDTFWLNINDYIKLFNPDQIAEAESIGKDIKTVSTRQANVDKTKYTVLTGNLVVK